MSLENTEMFSFENDERDFSSIEHIENLLLGSVIKDSSCKIFFEISDQLSPCDFTPTNGIVYSLLSKYLLELSNNILDVKVLQSMTTDNVIKSHLQTLFEDGSLILQDIKSAITAILNISQLRSLRNVVGELEHDVTFTDLSAQEIIEKYEKQIFSISEHRSESFVTPASCLADVLNNLDSQKESSTLSTSIKSLDAITNGLEPGELIIIAARPSLGKSALLLQMLTEIAANNLPVGFFSLEMTKKMIIERLLSYCCRIPLHKIRSRNLSINELSHIKNTVHKVSELPIVMDCSGYLTPQQFLSKARRMKIQHKNLSLIGVDYMQLMSAPGIKGGKEQEIAYISSVLKMAAKDLMIPIIAISQLSRSVEQREDKRPILSDLRNCVVANTNVALADGTHVPIQDIVGKTINVVSLKNNKVTNAYSPEIWHVGKKDTTKITFSSGKSIICTADHKFKKLNGWCKTSDLKINDRVAILRILPEPPNPIDISKNKLIILGHLIGDGSYLNRACIRYTSNTMDSINDLKTATEEEFGCKTKIYNYGYKWHQLTMTGSNRWHFDGLRTWLANMKILNQRSHEKLVPNEIFQTSNNNISIFLNRLFSTDGCVDSTHKTIYYSTTSKQLSIDVSNLLLRFGILTRIKITQKVGYKQSYNVYIYGKSNILTFANKIGIFGPKGDLLKFVAFNLSDIKENTNVDTIPIEIFDYVKQELRTQKISLRKCSEIAYGYRTTSVLPHPPSRKRMLQLANLLNDQYLLELSNSDIFWDKIIKIEHNGVEDVYDITVPETSCWSSNGIITHNSGTIEQDADLVMFIYRDSYYSGHSDDISAEISVSKNRNGPIGKVMVKAELDVQKFTES